MKVIKGWFSRSNRQLFLRCMGVYWLFRFATIWWWPMDRFTEIVGAVILGLGCFALAKDLDERAAWERRMRREMLRNETEDDSVDN